MTILNSKDAFMKKNKQLTIALSAFALTSLILLIVFYVSGVYPFGDRSLLKWDMELQYADFFRWWHRVLHGQASMFYSFSKSLGDNTFGLTAIICPVHLICCCILLTIFLFLSHLSHY